MSKLTARDNDRCWEWKGCLNENGYGVFRLGAPTRKSILAHRYAYSMLCGEIPRGMFVLHRCDNRKCCNPKHLFTGTQADNLADAAKKSRMRHGEDHHNSKLTKTDARFIKIWLSHGYPQRAIARAFGVSQSAVNSINIGRCWLRVSC